MKKRILVVDDDAGIVEALSDMLDIYGFEVCTVQRGDKVFENIVNYNPDLILMDIMLSGMDGRTICRALRAIDSTSKIPVILISGGNYETVSTMKQSFAADFIQKPFEMHDLIERIKYQLSIAEQADIKTAS
ncbi:response regulator [Mucilaginibacter sp.]